MVRPRTFGGAILATSLLVAAWQAAAANDPLGFDLREDGARRTSPLLLGPAPETPLHQTVEPVLRGNPLWGIPLESLRATREHPLFSPSRRPPTPAVIAPAAEPVKVAAPPPEPERPPLNLLGVVVGANDGYAVFMNTATHDIISLRTGEGHDGWILQSVKGHEAVLEKNHRTAVMSLPQPSDGKK